MIKINLEGGVYSGGRIHQAEPCSNAHKSSKDKTMAWKILSSHNHATGDNRNEKLKIRFDAMASHDITYVGIVQTARASGMTEFPLPYTLTNCHNSLCAVGGTINEDDHIFGLSAAKHYGGDFVPAHLAVIHQYVREVMAGCGRMILGSDSHTRYGALGTLGVGEGGPELVKQLLNRYYEIDRPEVVAIYLHGSPKTGVGPQDVALAIIGAVFKKGIVKNKIMEFVGPGIASLSTEYRIGIDVMTTETTCLTSIWETDERVKKYLSIHGREDAYKELHPEDGAFYDAVIDVDLSKIESMIALPFHPSNVFTVNDFLQNADDLLNEVEKETASYVNNSKYKPELRKKFRNGKLFVDQAVIAGCAGGGFENIHLAAKLLKGKPAGNPGFNLSVYPSSQPVFLELMKNGSAAALMESGAILRSAFCGPCFGAGDVPGNNNFSIRHTTRNFPNREGSHPATGQMSFVALMDARSIAATSLNGGVLTAATSVEGFPSEDNSLENGYHYDPEIYGSKVYHGWSKPNKEEELVFGPNIADWPEMNPLAENIVLEVASAIYDPVTTTDELIPSGETSSYRSNPLKLAEFTLSRKDAEYVGRAKRIKELQEERAKGEATPNLKQIIIAARAAGIMPSKNDAELLHNIGIGSCVFALKPGDGSAREQAASCQKVLGGWANISAEYATKRYRSNLINWGMLPLLFKDWETIKPRVGDIISIPNIRQAILMGLKEIAASVYREGTNHKIHLQIAELTDEERKILLAGCLINFYAAQKA